MKQISGKEFGRLIQRRGWQLARINAVTTSSPNPATASESSFPSTGVNRSNLGCWSSRWRSSDSPRPTS